MKQRTLIEAGVFVALVAACASLRLVFRDIPNFAPVAAAALFAGYFFRSAALALCVPLTAMAASDLVIGGYDWPMMATVYTMLALPVCFRRWLRSAWSLDPAKGSPWRSTAGLVGCSLGASVLFFLVTNFGCWFWFSTYEPTVAGLLHCYAMAVPFFRYTLAGDLTFAVVLFGSYAAVTQWAAAREVRVSVQKG